MTISIPTEFQPFVDQLVASGAYPSEDAVVIAALKRMRDDQAEFLELKASLDEAVAELDRGGGEPLDFEEIKRKGRALAAARRNG